MENHGTRVRSVAGVIFLIGSLSCDRISLAADTTKAPGRSSLNSSKLQAVKRQKSEVVKKLRKQQDNRTKAAPSPQTKAQPRKDAVKAASAPQGANSDEVGSLREQLAIQQRQIEQLRATLERIIRTQANERAAEAAPAQAPNLGQVASTAPVIPASRASAPASLGVPPEPAGKPSPQEKPPKLSEKLSDLAYGKIKIGGTFYGDYAFYTNTGFGPQFLTQINQAGPGNAGFNSFDVTRTYINIFYTPNEAVTLRFTPNIYRQVDVSSAQKLGTNAAIGSSSNGNLGFRLKYAYVDFNNLLKGSQAFGKGKVTVGQTTNPLVDWEEGLYGYRYVNLVPWNYLSLSSTYVGATVHGPVEFNGKEYLDYHLGVFNNASFHAIEQNDKKQVMGRLTWYPWGTKSDRTGFGVTAFMDYGYSNVTPDTRTIPLYRFAALAHYQTHDKNYEIVGEYDLGRNAFGTGNLFSGVGPADEFGLGPTPFATFDALAKAILGGDRTRQRGFGAFGHARIAKSPFYLFGMYEHFQPNTNVNPNPLDFQRTVGGISYKYNEHFEVALNNQNLKYTKSQFLMPASQIASFSSSLANSNPNGIPNVVPQGTNAIFINLLFNY